MGGWSTYFWLGAAGAMLGGVSSALLVLYASLAPDRHLLGSPELQTSAHTLTTILTGVLMGAASGACLRQYLHVRPAMKRSLLGLALVVALAMGVLGESGLMGAASGACLYTVSVWSGTRSGSALPAPEFAVARTQETFPRTAPSVMTGLGAGCAGVRAWA
jgi:hypothetical protein